MFKEELIKIDNLVLTPQKSYFAKVMILFGMNGLLGLFKLLLYATFLGPSEFGLFSICLLIVTVGGYDSTMGFLEALNRQVPILLGEGKFSRGSYYLSIALGFSTAVSLILGILFYITVSTVSVLERYNSVSIVGVLLVSTVIFNIILSGVRGRSLTVELGSLTLAKTIIAGGVGLAAAPYFGAKGVILAESFSLCLVALYGWRKYLPSVVPTFRKKIFYFPIMAVGLPFLLGNVILNLSQTIDSWFVQANYDNLDYGIYAFSMILFVAGQNFTGVLIQYIQPRALTDFGRSKDHRRLLHDLERISTFLGVFFLVGLIPFYWILNITLERYYPDFSGAMDFAIYIYAGTGMMGCLGVYETYILALKKGKVLMQCYAAALVFITLSCLTAQLQDFGIIAYAIIFCVGRL